MKISINLESKEPPFEQIKRSIAGLIARDELRPGTKLPTIRQLAGDLGVANNTVARAYRELETTGLIRSNGRRGSIVLSSAPAQHHEVTREIDALVANARKRGLDPTTVLGLVAKALAAE